MADDNWDTTPSHTGRRRIEQVLDKQDSSSTGSSTEGSDSSSSSSSDSDSKKDKEVVIEIIDNYDDALKFAQTYWNKIQRNNGRVLNCQVWGSTKWLSGEWCKVELPSFYIDGFMYITDVSESNDDGDWNATLTLVDFPPGWGKYEEPEEEDEEEEDEDTDEDADEDTDEDSDSS